MPTAKLVRVTNGYRLVVCGTMVGPKFKSPAEACLFVRDYLYGATQ